MRPVESPATPVAQQEQHVSREKPSILYSWTPEQSFVQFALTQPYWIQAIATGITVREVSKLDPGLYKAIHARANSKKQAGKWGDGPISACRFDHDFLIRLADERNEKEIEVLTRSSETASRAEKPAVQPTTPQAEKVPVQFRSKSGETIFAFMRREHSDQLEDGLHLPDLQVRDSLAYLALFNAWENTFERRAAQMVRSVQERHAEFRRLPLTIQVLDWLEHGPKALGVKPGAGIKPDQLHH
jgi:hypothetical protein